MLQVTRRDIDRIDGEVVKLVIHLGSLICQRMSLAGEIGAYKRVNGLPIQDRKREEEVITGAVAQVAAMAGETQDPFLEILISDLLRGLITAAKAAQISVLAEANSQKTRKEL